MNEPNWMIEFDESYECPGFITERSIDVSWHNDSCPSFWKKQDAAARLFVEHPDVDKREDPQAHRYTPVWGPDNTLILATDSDLLMRLVWERVDNGVETPGEIEGFIRGVRAAFRVELEALCGELVGFGILHGPWHLDDDVLDIRWSRSSPTGRVLDEIWAKVARAESLASAIITTPATMARNTALWAFGESLPAGTPFREMFIARSTMEEWAKAKVRIPVFQIGGDDSIRDWMPEDTETVYRYPTGSVITYGPDGYYLMLERSEYAAKTIEELEPILWDWDRCELGLK